MKKIVRLCWKSGLFLRQRTLGFCLHSVNDLRFHICGWINPPVQLWAETSCRAPIKLPFLMLACLINIHMNLKETNRLHSCSTRLRLPQLTLRTSAIANTMLTCRCLAGRVYHISTYLACQNDLIMSQTKRCECIWNVCAKFHGDQDQTIWERKTFQRLCKRNCHVIIFWGLALDGSTANKDARVHIDILAVN